MKKQHLFNVKLSGETLRGDRIVNTLFDVRMGQDDQCRILCKADPKSETPVSVTWNAEVGKLVAERIQEDYFVHL